jgi:transposase
LFYFSFQLSFSILKVFLHLSNVSSLTVPHAPDEFWGSLGKIPVFGILERRGKVRVEVVEDVSAESILRSAIKKVKRGSIIYTDRFRSYDGLVMYGFRHERIDHGKRFANGKVYINGIEGFWSYAKERLLKFHGVRRENFVYYIKELEFRYNNRDNLEEVLYKVLGGIY